MIRESMRARLIRRLIGMSNGVFSRIGTPTSIFGILLLAIPITTRVFCVSGTILAIASDAAAATFVTVSGLVSPSPLSDGAAISGNGLSIVGWSRTNQHPPGSTDEAFLWVWDEIVGTISGLGDLPGGTFESRALGVSQDGTVAVGWSQSSSGREAFIWNAIDGMVGLGDLPGGGSNSEAKGVSGDGSTVIGTGTSGTGINAFIWTHSTGMVPLGDLPGGSNYSDASAVSFDGSRVVGRSGSMFGQEAFIWDTENSMRGLGDLPGGAFASFATAVSADNSTVVGAGLSDLAFEAFVWDEINGMRRIGVLPDGIQSIAYGVSSDGSVVVGRVDYENTSEAFIWDEANGIRPLSDVLEGAGADLLGWHLSTASGISPNGVIVGTALNPNGPVLGGAKEGFRAELPEVSVSILLAVGGIGVAMLGARRGRMSERRR